MARNMLSQILLRLPAFNPGILGDDSMSPQEKLWGGRPKPWRNVPGGTPQPGLTQDNSSMLEALAQALSEGAIQGMPVNPTIQTPQAKPGGSTRENFAERFDKILKAETPETMEITDPRVSFPEYQPIYQPMQRQPFPGYTPAYQAPAEKHFLQKLIPYIQDILDARRTGAYQGRFAQKQEQEAERERALQMGESERHRQYEMGRYGMEGQMASQDRAMKLQEALNRQAYDRSKFGWEAGEEGRGVDLALKKAQTADLPLRRELERKLLEQRLATDKFTLGEAQSQVNREKWEDAERGKQETEATLSDEAVSLPESPGAPSLPDRIHDRIRRLWNMPRNDIQLDVYNAYLTDLEDKYHAGVAELSKKFANGDISSATFTRAKWELNEQYGRLAKTVADKIEARKSTGR